MALNMSSPLKHPKTGIYWLRKRVPQDLQPVLGKPEIVLSLRTRDPNEAKRLIGAKLRALDVQWTTLRHGPGTLTEHVAHSIATPLFRPLGRSTQRES